MININSIERDKKNIIKNFKPEETEILKEEYSTFESLATKINSF